MERKQYHGKPGTKALNIVRQYFPQVTKLVDANAPAIIEVTPDDAAKATVRDPAFCALARACHRSFMADGVIIGLTTAYVIQKKKAIRYHNTEGISREIVSFDRKGGFEPGLYKMAPFCPSCRLGVFKGGRPHPRSQGKDRRQFKHWTKGVRVLNRSEEVSS